MSCSSEVEGVEKDVKTLCWPFVFILVFMPLIGVVLALAVGIGLLVA